MSRADYAPSVQPERGDGGVVASVDDGSPAADSGILAGDVIERVGDDVLRDIIDWQWLTDGTEIELRVTAPQQTARQVRLRRAGPQQPWGIRFEELVFDGVRTCHNSCAFCFMTQLPRGMRTALYLRDDDYRLSFLQGNFVSLTNLDDDDVDRIATQHLSPLYVSLHAADPAVRQQLICAREDRALQRFDELLAEDIELHVQIVLVPHVNDGDELENTLVWLAKREGVASVGIVPLGYTAHQQRFDLSYNTRDSAAAVIEQVERWQVAMRERDDVTWVYLADEFYLNAQTPVPSAEWYDDFPQYENGIGIVRSFIDDATALLPQLKRAVTLIPEDSEAVTLLTGALSEATLADALAHSGAVGRVRVLPVQNRFFGGNVSVSGLLTGADVTRTVREDRAKGIYLLTGLVFNADGVTLDGMTLDELRARSGADIRLVSSDAAGLLTGLEQVGAELASTTKE